MLRLLGGAGVVVLLGLWLVGANSQVPAGASQYAPPPTPRPGELSLSFSSADLSQRLGASVQLVPNQVLLGAASGHVDLQQGRPIVVLSDPAMGSALQALLDQELARRGIGYVRSVSHTQDQLLLIGTASF